ncbi:MAG: hypothetical protein HY267_08230 [Deltaproteobacteria bacterium]|nr:hypothetical protein [Deltaproteobacteria bacterium]
MATEVQALRRAVATVEAEIANKARETVVVFAADGTVLVRKEGTSNRVTFTLEEKLRMRGAALYTHNHPRGTSFSPRDIRNAKLLDLKEQHAVGKHYLYILRPPTEGWKMIAMAELNTAVAAAQQQVLQEFQAQIRRGQLSLAQADLSFWHTIWTRVARQFRFHYTRRTR